MNINTMTFMTTGRVNPRLERLGGDADRKEREAVTPGTQRPQAPDIRQRSRGAARMD
jgi:hypothetical protein